MFDIVYFSEGLIKKHYLTILYRIENDKIFFFRYDDFNGNIVGKYDMNFTKKGEG